MSGPDGALCDAQRPVRQLPATAVEPAYELRDSDLTWTSEPVPIIEAADVGALDADAMVLHVGELRAALACVRETLHVAVACLAATEQQNTRLRERLRELNQSRTQAQGQDRDRTGTGEAQAQAQGQ